jgi:hypothetical protein
MAIMQIRRGDLKIVSGGGCFFASLACCDVIYVLCSIYGVGPVPEVGAASKGHWGDPLKCEVDRSISPCVTYALRVAREERAHL